MTRAIRLPLALLFVLLVGTANSAGYRFGVSDQAFYIPAVSLRADPSLFPRDRAVFEPQMRLWIGDEVLGAVVRATDVPLPTLFAVLYVVTMAGLALAAIALARGLGCSWWAIAVCLILLTLRHRIARTGANSLEGYMHPRMLAFACGVMALAFVARSRPRAAVMWTLAASVVHTSTAIWFSGVVLASIAWTYRGRRAVAVMAVALVCAAGAVAAVMFMPRMDQAWLAVLADRDYLFSTDWPLFAWVTNLAYPVVLYAIYRRRRSLGIAGPGEAGLVAGLMALVAGFLLTLPLVETHLTFFVQLQANRVFWLLDVVVAVYVAWWLAEDVMARWPAARRATAVALLALLAIGRGAFVLHETGRPLAQMAPARDDWMDVMQWLRGQPTFWHVLADPGHASKYGVTVRAAALRDTPLEIGKDPAMAMYDRALAMRVAERTVALGGFDAWTTPEEVRTVAERYGLHVFVDRTDRTFPFPTLFRNTTFVVYDLR